MEAVKSKEKRIDRRKIYTVRVIKEAFLELKRIKPFNEITITELCKEAEISRGTFYLHYHNTMDVLDEIMEDALNQTLELPEFASLDYEYADPFVDNKCKVPICEMIRASNKYRSIFLDDSLTDYIAGKIMDMHIDNFVVNMKKKTTISEDELRNFYYFRLMGCLAVTKRTIHYSQDEWKTVKSFIDNIQRTGVEPYKKQERKKIHLKLIDKNKDSVNY